MKNYIVQSACYLDKNGEPLATRLILGDELHVNNIDFVLFKPWTVSGKVILHDGTPVQDAEVAISYSFPYDDNVNVISSPHDITTALMGNYENIVKTASDGNFTYIGTNYVFGYKSKFTIFASHETYQRTPSELINPKPGKEITGITLKFEDKVNVKGIVLDKRNKPIQGAEVLFWPLPEGDQSKYVKQKTKEDGTFKMSLTPGIYSARFIKKIINNLPCKIHWI